MPAPEALVAQVKENQRNDPVFKDQWGKYCQQHGEGFRDPSKHEAYFIQAFLDQYASGAFADMPVEGADALVTLIKEGQRRSSNFKTAWSGYCQMYGSGFNDPAKHDHKFIVSFLDFVGQRGTASLSWGAMGTPPGMMHMGGPALKKARTAPVSTGDPMKDRLVERIKNYQKSGDAQKQAWWTFCDMNLEGHHDPARHETAILSEFIRTYGVP
eukprot:gnl/TRDRNA2_/TRDRNA2_179305_c0_seq1.p1 gnl/TRDRNA2_/TRDRNA2_179305_c0~~gnl/TRDRNA2_/TRDRNA2_179305_c0_seq1.p1  ORF type:complete len:240 (+),score=19.47 gnl/TRDRNA2_/TRDRNA2_179305_c0_seq1:83-721(+)